MNVRALIKAAASNKRIPNIAITGTAKSSAARAFSNQPEDTVYGGPSPAVAKRITLKTLRSMYAKGEPISMVTAYDYPSAVHVSLQASFGSHGRHQGLLCKQWCSSEHRASRLPCKLGTTRPCLLSVACSMPGNKVAA